MLWRHQMLAFSGLDLTRRLHASQSFTEDGARWACLLHQDLMVSNPRSGQAAFGLSVLAS